MQRRDHSNFTMIPCDVLILLELYVNIRNFRLCSIFLSKLNYFRRLNTRASLEYYKKSNVRARFRLSLCFYKCKVKDVSILAGVHTLDLSNCGGITDVSSLGGVHVLYLNDCQGIRDVSMLGGAHTLFLSRCKGITDVFSLGRVQTLNLDYCQGITE